jgi:hypothetical protein
MSSEYVGKVPALRVDVEWGQHSQALGCRWSFRDSEEDTFLLNFGIPWLITLELAISFLPGRFVHWCLRGNGAAVYYGAELNHYQAQLQWGKFLDVPGKAGGFEWRRVWEDLLGKSTKVETLLSKQMVGGSLPSTEKVPYQHFFYQVWKYRRVSSWNVWWRPSYRETYYVVAPISSALRDAEGRWVPTQDLAAEYFYYVRCEEDAVEEYAMALYERLGFDPEFL